MKKILIYGAGAIGRGYLPRVFTPGEFEFYFVETNPTIREILNRQKSYTSYMTVDGEYKVEKIPVLKCFDIGEELEQLKMVDGIFVAVGPRNFLALRNQFSGVDIPIICFENDSSLPGLMRKATGNENVVFGIPDVITSNSAPPEFQAKDPLSIVTENGTCFVDQKANSIGGNCRYVDEEELQKQWLAKLYIHNTPHCVAAYLGGVLGVRYVHEAMSEPKVYGLVESVMLEMRQMLRQKYSLDDGFLDFYSRKELRRFRNVLLFDPVSRVGREPFRKLAPNERLIGAAQLCLSCGIVPTNLLTGIMAAFCFENDSDPDSYIRHLMKALSPEEFLRIIIGLGPEEALFNLMIEEWEHNLKTITEIRNAG